MADCEGRNLKTQESMPERIYYKAQKTDQLNMFLMRAQRILFTKAIRKILVMGAQTLLRRSTVTVFYSLGLTEDTQIKFSF